MIDCMFLCVGAFLLFRMGKYRLQYGSGCADTGASLPFKLNFIYQAADRLAGFAAQASEKLHDRIFGNADPV